MWHHREDTQLILCGITARGFCKTEPQSHPTKLSIPLELTLDVYVITQWMHRLEWHIFSGDLQMSETRRIVRQTPTFDCSRGLSHIYSCSSTILDHLTFVLILLIANGILQKTCISPCQSSVPKSRIMSLTHQTFYLHTRPTISLLPLSSYPQVSKYHLLVSLTYF